MGFGYKFSVLSKTNVNRVGIDVSKDKRMIIVMRPLGEMVIPSFEVSHPDIKLYKLSRLLGGPGR